MSDLAEFLLARITEDEAAAQLGAGEPRYSHHGDTAAEESVDMARNEGCAKAGPDHLARWLPARVLAECEAKRRIVWLHTGPDYRRDRPDLHLCKDSMTPEVECDTLRALAVPYRDHPDYDPAWEVS